MNLYVLQPYHNHPNNTVLVYTNNFFFFRNERIPFETHQPNKISICVMDNRMWCSWERRRERERMAKKWEKSEGPKWKNQPEKSNITIFNKLMTKKIVQNYRNSSTYLLMYKQFITFLCVRWVDLQAYQGWQRERREEEKKIHKIPSNQTIKVASISFVPHLQTTTKRPRIRSTMRNIWQDEKNDGNC